MSQEQKGSGRQLSPQNCFKINFRRVEGPVIQRVFSSDVDPVFDQFVRQHAEVDQFARDWERWCSDALHIMSTICQPNISMQDKLVDMLLPVIGRSVTDLERGALLVELGSGAGDFLAKLLKQMVFRALGRKVTPEEIHQMELAQNSDWQTIQNGFVPLKRILAVDLVDGALRKTIDTVIPWGYRQKLGTLWSSTMSRSVVKAETADCVVSSIGGLTYAGWWFKPVVEPDTGKLVDAELVFEGPDALRQCLCDVNRILRPNGHLAFSSLKPNLSTWHVLTASILWPLVRGRFRQLFGVLKTGPGIRRISEFLRTAEANGHAHYLSLPDWTTVLNQSGFEVVDQSIGECYAKQGVVIVARKVT